MLCVESLWVSVEGKSVNFTGKASRIFDKAVAVSIVLSGAIIFADALAVSADNLSRYFSGHSWGGLYEIAEYSLVWMTFLGITWLLKKNIHIHMDIVASLLPDRRRLILAIAAYCICIVPVGVALWSTTGLVIEDMLEHRRFVSVLELPTWPLEIIMPIGCLMLFIQLLIRIHGLVVDLRSLSAGREIQFEEPAPEDKTPF